VFFVLGCAAASTDDLLEQQIERASAKCTIKSTVTSKTKLTGGAVIAYPVTVVVDCPESETMSSLAYMEYWSALVFTGTPGDAVPGDANTPQTDAHILTVSTVTTAQGTTARYRIRFKPDCVKDTAYSNTPIRVQFTGTGATNIYAFSATLDLTCIQ